MEHAVLICLGMQLKRSMHISTACHSQSPREQFSRCLRQTHILKEALRMDARFGCLCEVPGSSLKEAQHLNDERLISLAIMDMFGGWRPRLVTSSRGCKHCMELVRRFSHPSQDAKDQAAPKQNAFWHTHIHIGDTLLYNRDIKLFGTREVEMFGQVH